MAVLCNFLFFRWTSLTLSRKKKKRKEKIVLFYFQLIPVCLLKYSYLSVSFWLHAEEIVKYERESFSRFGF